MQRLLLYFFLAFLPIYSFADGNDTLGHTYSRTACGLTYLTVSHVLGQRFAPQGESQPAVYEISGLPKCAIIEKAFLYADASGAGDAQTPVVAGPLDVSSYPMTIIGTAPDKCWGFPKTVSYRADITPTITGNGTYTVNGFATNNSTDIDGATIMVIYRDPAQSWQGTIIIDDGAEETRGLESYTTHFSIPCSHINNTRAFLLVGDYDQGEDVSLNGTIVNGTTKYWNFFDSDAPILPTATSAGFTIFAGSDCYNIVMAGVYYQSTCSPCFVAPPLQLTTTSTSSHCNSCDGSAHVAATGSNGQYVYSWMPTGGNGTSATGLCPGVYTVTVSSGCDTASTTVTISDLRPSFSLGDDITICSDSSAVLKTNDTNSVSYLWNTGASTYAIVVDSPGTYWLCESDLCSSTTDTIVVSTRPCSDKDCLFFPNAFSPNNDGHNDTYGPVSGCKAAPDFYHLQIYDRWEKMIFESKDINTRWDGTYNGTPQDMGVYFYQLEYTEPQSFEDPKRLKGDFILVR